MGETCVAMVAELTDAAIQSVIHIRKVNDRVETIPPKGWKKSPLKDGMEERTYYEGAFSGCNSGSPLGDLPGALTRPGAFYKVINGGEGILIIVPRAKLAGFFYLG